MDFIQLKQKEFKELSLTQTLWYLDRGLPLGVKPLEVDYISKKFIYIKGEPEENKRQYSGACLFLSEDDVWERLISLMSKKLSQLEYLTVMSKNYQKIKDDRPHLFV